MSKIKSVNHHQIVRYLLKVNPDRSKRLIRLTRNVWQSDERISIDPLIWQMSLLTSIFYLVVAGGVIGTYPATAENNTKFYLAQAEIETLTPEVSTPQPEEIATEEVEQTEEATASVQNLERAIIAELNRARTNPQGYADWLESQKQYYQGMFLKLPGEEPIRTNRGLQALEDAIAFLRQQTEITPLSFASELVSTAQSQVNAIVNNQKINYQESHLVYGKVTPEAIVMQLIVDDGFPDRRHRKAVFQQDSQNAGIVCSEIAVYNQVCAIAYEDTAIEIAQQPTTIVKPETKPEDTAVTESDLLPPPKVTNLPDSDIADATTETTTELEAPPEVTVETKPTPEETTVTETPETTTEATTELEAPPEVAVETKPTPEETTVTETPETITETTTELEAPPEVAVETKPTPEETTVTETPETTTEATTELEAPPEVAVETKPTPEETTVTETPETTTEATTELEAPPEESTVAVNFATEAEFVENGMLEEGDDVIPNDGSFYDSYPLEGVAGDSFVITLESQDFDTFLAVMDGEGNIIEQNDDVNEQDSNSSIDIVLPQDGTYSVIVNAYDREGKGSYTLKVGR